MKKLNDIVCGEEGKLYNVCNQIELPASKDKKIAQTGLYLVLGSVLRYIIPLVIFLFVITDVSYIMLMSYPFITLVGYAPIYAETANNLFLWLNITLCVAFYIYSFITVGFETFTPLVTALLVSVMTFPSLPIMMQITGIFLSIVINVIPWEFIIIGKKAKKGAYKPQS